MARYSIKIAEIHLRSDMPITAEARVRAIRALMLRNREPILSLPEGDAVVYVGLRED